MVATKSPFLALCTLRLSTMRAMPPPLTKARLEVWAFATLRHGKGGNFSCSSTRAISAIAASAAPCIAVLAMALMLPTASG